MVFFFLMSIYFVYLIDLNFKITHIIIIYNTQVFVHNYYMRTRRGIKYTVIPLISIIYACAPTAKWLRGFYFQKGIRRKKNV